MISLSTLKNTHRASQTKRRVGRGVGCKKGKTCGRGTKGAKARSGYKRRYGNEGGQLPLYRKLPTRGFTNARFKKEYKILNLCLVEDRFNDGDVVNREALIGKGLVSKNCKLPIKLLGQGDLKKKLSFELDALSKGAKEKLDKGKISFQSCKTKGA